MKRSLAFIGVLTFAAVQPAVTLAAHPGGQVFSRPAMPAPAPLPVAPVARGGSANQGDFKVPFHVNVQPQIHVNSRPLSVEPPLRVEPQRFTVVRPAAFTAPARPSSYRWYHWQPTPVYLWYPGGSAWNGPACLLQTSPLNAPSDLESQDFSVGSLVDGKANLLSPQSYNPGYAAGTNLAAVSSTPFTFQVGFYPTACGAPGFTSW